MASRDDVALSDSLAETLTSPSSSSIQKLSVPTLPFDLVVEILALLPVKSLMQLRCVCKSWKSLISDPKFAKKQLRASMPITSHHHLMLTFFNRQNCTYFFVPYSLSSFFTERTPTGMELEYPLKTNRTSYVHCAGSCHGLLCFHHDNGVAFLWNPSIRKFTKLPPLEKEGGPSYYLSFGYDNFSDSYKVVAVSCYQISVINDITAYKTQVMIHTLGTHSWRKMQDLPFESICDETVKFLNGTINWLASRPGGSPKLILSFDFEKESYRELQPDFGGEAIGALDLDMFKDCLWLLSHADTYTDIWIMKEFGNKESWTKIVHIPNNGGINSFFYVIVLYVSEDDQVLLDINAKLVIYNSNDGTFKDCNVQNINPEWMTADVYLESLISPYF